MIIETELKFPVTDFGPVLEKLGRVNGEHTRWYFEQNIVLDDEKGSLKKKDVLLRLRTGLENKLTLKLPVEQGRDELAKKRREYETSLDNIQDMKSIFGLLEFQPWLRYEKFRQVWKLDKVKICLDILPFGRFVEIEGPEEGIIETALNLGLDPLTATAKTYHQLNREMAGQGAAASDDFVFDDDMKKSIELELDTGFWLSPSMTCCIPGFS
jgi:adenylate cyclase, class 2